MDKKLTKKQQEVLQYVKKFVVEHGFPPSTREICAGLNLSSPATVHAHLKHLEKAGCIRKTNSKFRTIEILVENEFDKQDDNIIKVPLLGKITAGSPIEAIEMPDTFFDLPASLVSSNKEIFTLKVSGESMINAGIFDGDIVIVERQNTAHNGQIIVAMTEENETKKLVKSQ